MSPRISVIIPAFNSELFIADAISSVLAQKYSSEMEIIVIDDGSSDHTRAVVSELARHHPQIKLIENDRTKGPSGARNVGLLYASGDYVAFLDADDVWLPNHIGEGVDFLDKNKGVDVVFYNFEVHDYKKKEKLNDWFSMRSFWKKIKVEGICENYFLILDDMFNSLLDEMFLHLQSMIIRRESINGVLFNEGVKRSEDRDFAIRLYMSSKAKFAFRNLVTGIYYRHENSLTSRSVENSLLTILDQIKLYSEYLLHEWVDDHAAEKLKRMLFSLHLSASYHYRLLNSHKHALAHCLQSYRYRIAVSQFKELGKILFSLSRYNIQQLAQVGPLGVNRQ